MNIEIKSTSYLIPNNSSWGSLYKDNKLKFAEYNNIFNNSKFNQKNECEIFVLFLKDIIDYYKVLKNINKSEIKKIKLIINFIEKKTSTYKKKNFIISISSYYYFNHINSEEEYSFLVGPFSELCLEPGFLSRCFHLSLAAAALSSFICCSVEPS